MELHFSNCRNDKHFCLDELKLFLEFLYMYVNVTVTSYSYTPHSLLDFVALFQILQGILFCQLLGKLITQRHSRLKEIYW